MPELDAQLEQLWQTREPWDPPMEPVRASSPLDPGEGAAAVAAEEEPARGKLGGRKKDKDGREGPRRRERKGERRAPPLPYPYPYP